MNCVERIKKIFDEINNKIKEKKMAKEKAAKEKKIGLLTLHKGINLPIVLNQIILRKNEVCH